MKISLFSAFYPFRGGIAQFNARLSKELVKKNELSTFTFKKQYPNFLFPGKSQYVESDINTDLVTAERIVSIFNPFSYFSALKKIRKSNSDVFITNYWMTFFGPFMGFVAKKLGPKTKRIAILHNLIPHEKRFFDSWFNTYFVKHYDGFIVLSESVKNDLLSLKPDAKFILIPHPLYDHFGERLEKNEACNQLKISSEKRTLLFFGIIRDYKGLDLLIDAFTLLPDDYQLIIAGEVYGDAKKYVEQIESSSKKEDIHFFNKFIADDEVNAYFSCADLCVLPYRSATQSGVTAISHYFAIPVLATNVGGLNETIDPGKTGFIVEKAEVQCIADGIKNFFNSSNLEQTKIALEQLKSERSWEVFNEKLEAFIKDLAK